MCNVVTAQCPIGQIDIQSQVDVDSFAFKYPNCNTVDDIFIFGDGIIDLTPLSVIDSVMGQIVFYGLDSLQSLQGIGQLDYVGEFIGVQANENLVSIDNLLSIDNFSGEVLIKDNPSIKHIEWSGEADTMSYITIENNHALERIVGGSSVSHIYGSILIVNCDALLEVTGFESIESISKELVIATSSKLESVDAFRNIREIGTTFTLSGNASLSQFGALDSLQKVGDFSILNNNFETLPSFDALDTVVNQFYILDDILRSIDGFSDFRYCSHFVITSNSLEVLSGFESFDSTQRFSIFCRNLETIDAFENLRSAKSFSISRIHSLLNLDNFRNLKRVGDLRLQGSSLDDNVLTDISGLSGLDADYLEEIVIIYVDNLSMCGIAPICTFLEDSLSDHGFGNNSTGCNSRDEILASCDALSSSAEVLDFEMSPNPVEDYLQIRSDRLIDEYVISSIDGATVIRRKANAFAIDIPTEDLTSGMYVVQLRSDGIVSSRKFVKK